MAKLNIVDLDNFILSGDFEKIKPTEGTVLSDVHIKSAVERYNELAQKGEAFGHLNDGFMTFETTDGVTVDDAEREPAFMILWVKWDDMSNTVVGSLIILDTEDGKKIKEAILIGKNCYISSSETESYDGLNKDTTFLEYRVTELKGYKLSLI